MAKNQNYSFIINPVACKQKTDRLIKTIKKIFTAKNYNSTFTVTEGPGHATVLARKAAENKTEVVVAVGGDGTVNEVVNGLAGSKSVFAVIPAGTGNDFAHVINMDKNIEKACWQIIRGKSKLIDLGTVGDRFFINLVGVGFDGAVANLTNQHSKRIPGPWMYLLSVFKTLVSYKAVNMKITLDDKILEYSPMLVAIGSGKYYGGGIKILPDSLLDDGFFDVCIIRSLGKLESLNYLARALSGKHTNLKKTEIYRCRYLKLEMAAKLPFHVEGEVFFAKELEFTIQPEAIKVITG